MKLITVSAGAGAYVRSARHQMKLANVVSTSAKLARIYLILALAWAVLKIMKCFGKTL